MKLLSSLSLSTSFKQVSTTFIVKIGCAFLGMATSVVISRSLGPEGRGEFVTASMLAALGSQFANLGLQTSNTYFVAKEPDLLKSLIANSVLFGLASGSLTACAMLLMIHFFNVMQDINWILRTVALLWIPIGLCYSLIQNLLLGILKINVFNKIEVVLKLSALVLVVLFWLLGAAEPIYYLLASLLASTLGIYLVWTSLNQPLSVLGSPVLSLLRQHIPFALKNYLAALFAYMLVRVDLLMVQHLVGNTETGHYSIAVSMADMLYMLPAAAGMVIYPKLCAIPERSARLRMVFKLLVHLTWVMLVLGLIAAWLAAPAVSLLFGKAFLESVPMCHILIGAMIFYGISNVFSFFLTSDGLPWSSVWVWLVALLINLSLNWVWIPKFGGEGAAYASLIAYAVTCMLQCALIIFHKEKADARI